ncbi:MAG: hypothetical protein H6608_03240 [Flavobacteriales bacterium]|nr:hypothetical protein [Bacteroidota bacterium]MCB9240119.1 hypothetical protein [Flavobacteriales bacterium]
MRIKSARLDDFDGDCWIYLEVGQHTIKTSSSMTYKDQLIQELKNTHGHLMAKWMKDSSPFIELAGQVEDFMHRKSPEGKVASLFIIHQLIGETIKQLIIFCEFYERVCVYPAKKMETRLNPGMTIKELIKILNGKIEFKSKKMIAQAAAEINDLRNSYGHQMIYRMLEQNYDYSELDDIHSRFDAYFEHFKVGILDLSALIEKAKKREVIYKLVK